MIKFLKSVVIPSKLTEEEVIAALDIDEWRSIPYIIELIKKQRKKFEEVDVLREKLGDMFVAFYMTTMRSHLYATLDSLDRQGVVRATETDKLTSVEMRSSSDPLLARILEDQKISDAIKNTRDVFCLSSSLGKEGDQRDESG